MDANKLTSKSEFSEYVFTELLQASFSKNEQFPFSKKQSESCISIVGGSSIDNYIMPRITVEVNNISPSLAQSSFGKNNLTFEINKNKNYIPYFLVLVVSVRSENKSECRSILEMVSNYIFSARVAGDLGRRGIFNVSIPTIGDPSTQTDAGIIGDIYMGQLSLNFQIVEYIGMENLTSHLLEKVNVSFVATGDELIKDVFFSDTSFRIIFSGEISPVNPEGFSFFIVNNLDEQSSIDFEVRRSIIDVRSLIVKSQSRFKIGFRVKVVYDGTGMTCNGVTVGSFEKTFNIK